MSTIVRSYSKINLGLAIGPVRPDGFHGLTTLYQTLGLHDLVTVSAKLVHTGTSSMHFAVDVSARDPREGGAGERLCTHCVIVFVALDSVEGAPAPVPAWAPRDDEDRRLSDYATQVMALSKGIEQAIARYRDADMEKAAG